MSEKLGLDKTNTRVKDGVLSTLAFFSLYHLPLSSKRIWELTCQAPASLGEIETALAELLAAGKITESGSLYSLYPWNAAAYQANQLELTRKWAQIDRYFGWLSLLPFVRGVFVINSLALGTADADSDIDFLVVTKKRRLYFVRSAIIVLFRLLGVYKTRTRIKDRFCFGFFADESALGFEKLLLKPHDPYFVNWLASLRPLLGHRAYRRLMQDNAWLQEQVPNFDFHDRLSTLKSAHPAIGLIKFLLEIILWLPAELAEPALRRIHVTHTFKLAENRAVTSTTMATPSLLKLHAYDVRAEVAREFDRTLQSLR